MGTTTVEPGDYLTSPNTSNFFVTPTDSNEVLDILNNLDPTKSRDIYGISPRYVIDARGFLSESLAELFNKSIEDHCFPNDQKIAKVLPTHKGKSKLNHMNYRPISVLPIFSKVLERLMYNRLVSFIQKQKLLYLKQYGFQSGKSTELAINSLLGNIITSLENKQTHNMYLPRFCKSL